jgi:hypothetical protein
VRIINNISSFMRFSIFFSFHLPEGPKKQTTSLLAPPTTFDLFLGTMDA